ncbi:MAG: VanW family protein [Pseudomonadota bacterium]
MSRLRAVVRHLLPLHVRQSLMHAGRRLGDAKNGLDLTDRRAAAADLAAFTMPTEIVQPVQPSALFENKLVNLTLGARRVNLALLEPGRIWSFWRYVGQPVEGNGFVIGRNLVDGQLTRQVGGGLCQLSSLIYHLGLTAGLDVHERNAHSIDIYQEHERFTPLGADATVVWGYKDLRLGNPHATPVVLECFVRDNTLVGRIYTREKLAPRQIEFVREPQPEQCVLVHTLVNGQPHTQTRYRQKQGLGLQPASP